MDNAKQLNIKRVPIDSIHPDPANVRLHDERSLESIKNSLARFGQQKPIVVDRRGTIRAGNGTYAAARALGWTEIDVVETDLDGVEATAYSAFGTTACSRTPSGRTGSPSAVSSSGGSWSPRRRRVRRCQGLQAVYQDLRSGGSPLGLGKHPSLFPSFVLEAGSMLVTLDESF